MSMFKQATRKKKKLRLLLAGPTDAGKTRTALRFAFGIVAHELKLAGINRPPKIWGIDTEHGRMSFYKNLADDGVPYIFDVCELESFAPQTAVAALRECWAAGLDAVVMDSLSHFWGGSGGVLEQHKQATEKRKDKNSYAAWSDATAVQNQFIEALLKSPMHVVATVRQKMDAVQEKGADGKTIIRSIGLQDEQRDTLRYEFDVIGNIDQSHELTIVKTPWDAMDKGPVTKPGADFILPLVNWLNEAEGDYERPSFPELSPDAAAALAVASGAEAAATTAAKVRQATKGGKGTAATTTTLPPPPAADATIKPEQVAEISLSLNMLQLAGQPAAMLAKRGVDKLEALSVAQADEILATLRPKVAAHKERQVASGIVRDTEPAAMIGELSTAEENLVDAIKSHDWYFEMSDDGNVFRRGTASQQRLNSAAMAVTENRRIKLWDAYSPKRDGVLQFQCPGVSAAKSADPNRVGSINSDDEKRIVAAIKKLRIGDENLKAILMKRMTSGNPPCPVRSIPDLSFNQGKDILEKLTAKIRTEFGENAF